MATSEVLPPTLGASSEPPAIFDGTPKLYIAYICPYAQRAWIARNYKGLQDKVKLVAIELNDRPAWYKEKVYPENKVPALEYNNEIKGESLDLVKFFSENFEGPSLYPDDPAKKTFADELLTFSDSFIKTMFATLRSEGISDAVAGFDALENYLSKFEDGPFFLGQFSAVDIAFIPFIERFQTFFNEFKNYDITQGRPKLAHWIEEVNKIDAYKVTKRDAKEHVESFKKKFQAAAKP
ncbi:protein IN2-1 homolog B-like [Ipomoea triloba]|uniref:protein IN2-1 homolog B-like n=1 Tax=Ipomoea triloba TaxID=35885 RepID=UPI00125D5239|nr:protein IN2-1 homolog B-like [Ipomoea triloba]